MNSFSKLVLGTVIQKMVCKVMIKISSFIMLVLYKLNSKLPSGLTNSDCNGQGQTSYTLGENNTLIMKTNFKNGESLFNFTNVFGMVEMKKGFTLVELLVVDFYTKSGGTKYKDRREVLYNEDMKYLLIIFIYILLFNYLE